MGKGSKQRPTAQTFWDNWDAVFGEKEEVEEKTHEYDCYKCGGLDEADVFEEIEVNHEPMGDTTVPRTMIILTCERCGQEVDYTG